MDRLTQPNPAHPQREAWVPAVQAAQPAPRQDGGSQERMAWLVRTIEAEIIPRLMLAHRTGPLLAKPADATPIAVGPDDVIELARIVLDHETSVAGRFVDALREQGVLLDAIYLDLLAPTARRLGEMWDADQCDFTQVTVGLWRLQQVMYDLSPDFQSDAEYGAQSRRAMLVPVPGSQHTLGLFMVAEFFRRAGWEVSGEPSATNADLVEAVRADWYDLVGISVGAEFQIEGLSSVILAMRQASRNPALGIMVGGPVVTLHPDFYTRVGADATAADAPQALAEAESLLASRAHRC